MKQPNVILILADQWRGDCLGVAGHPDVMTPYFDTLATEGLRFRNCYSATPTCIAARAALHTGMSQENHRRVGYADGVPWTYPHTLAGEFAKAGYQCHCAGKMHVHPQRKRLGYHSIDLHDGYLHYYRQGNVPYFENQRIADDYNYWLKNELGVDADVMDTGIDCNSFVARPWIYPEKYHPTRWVTDRAIDFLRRRDREAPFFLTVSYLRPHPPFDAPEPFFAMYRDRELAPPLMGDWANRGALARAGRIFDSATGPLDEKLQREARVGYYACMTQVDYEYGRLRDAMFTHNLNRSNTIVLFVSDHGEMLSDHALFRKSLPYRGSAQVPFLLSAPQWAVEACGGTTDGVEERLVELRDVMPTLLSLCGIPVPDTVDGENVLSPTFRRTHLHGEHLYGGGDCHWIVTERDKLIWFSDTGRRQYFDLVRDPDELHNAVDDPEYGDRVRELESVLVEELAWREEGFVENGALVPGRPVRATLAHAKRERCGENEKA